MSNANNIIAFVVRSGVEKEVYRNEAESLGLSNSALVAASLPIDRSGGRPVLAPRLLTPENILVANSKKFLGSLASVLRGTPDGREPDWLPVGSPPPIFISPRDAARAILARLIAGTLELGPAQVAMIETLRSQPND